MDNSVIHITVHGNACCGKSRLILHLMNTLRDQGFNVEFTADNDHATIKEFEQRISKNAGVVVEHIRTTKTIAQIKFSLILSKKWFNEFKTFEENTLNLRLDGQDLAFTFELSEKEEKI